MSQLDQIIHSVAYTWDLDPENLAESMALFLRAQPVMYRPIGCRTCRDAGKDREDHFSGEWDNCNGVHALDVLRMLIRAQKEIVAIHAAVGFHARFCWGDFVDNTQCLALGQFMTEHAGHELAPMNEYGDFDDECGKLHKCACCPAQWRCVLPEKHEPPCRPKR